MANIFQHLYYFPITIAANINPKSKRFLQDGTEFIIGKTCNRKMGAHVFRIHVRSPGINPIENLFHQVARKLQHDSLMRQITNESFEQFSDRVNATLEAYPANEIDKIIVSMDKRYGLDYKGKRAVNQVLINFHFLPYSIYLIYIIYESVYSPIKIV